MKAYVLTSGEYSGYGIHGVFSSTEKVEEYLAAMPKQERDDGKYRIEEYEIDGERPLVYGPEWTVSLHLDGSIMDDSCWNHDITEQHYEGARGSTFTYPSFYRDEDRHRCDRESGLFIGHSYISRDHALKLAIEERQNALREHPEIFAKGKD